MVATTTLRHWWIGSCVFVSIVMWMGFMLKPAVGQATGDPAWTLLGPTGGTMFEITAAPNNPDILFVRSIAGLHRTADGGATWQLILPYYMARGRAPIIMDPSNSNRMIMLLETNGIRLSTDGGFTWSAIGGGFSTTGVAIDAAGVLWATGDDEVFRSDDHGATWTELPFTPNQIAVSVVAHPTIAEKVYVRTPGGGLYGTDDGGATWQQRGGLGPHRMELIDPATNSLYAVSGTSTAGPGIYKSTNDGVSWTAFDTGLPNQITSLVADPHDSTRLYAAAHNGDIYRTTGDGSTWEPLNAGLPDGYSVAGGQLAMTADTPAALFYADDGVYRSVDGGTTWQMSDNGISALNIQGVAVDPGMPARVFASHWRNRIYHSEDGGTLWNYALLPQGVTARRIAVAPGDPNILYAGTEAHGVYRSTDGGGHWEAASAGIPPEDYDYVVDLAVAPDDPAHVVAALDIGRIYHSTNGGLSWTMAYDHDDSLRDVRFTPEGGTTVWVSSQYDLLKSTDGGETWTIPVVTGLPSNASKNALAVHPTDGDRLYVSTFISNMSTTQGGIYRSTDGGATWESLSTGLPNNVAIDDIWIDPTAPDTMLIAANRHVYNQPVPYGYGVHRSTDGGTTWSPFNKGLTHQAVVQLAGVGDTVYAGTVYGGVWRLGAAPLPITPTPSNTAVPPTASATAVPPLASCSTVNAPIGTNTPISDTIFPGLTGLVTDLDVIVVVDHPSVGELNYRLSNSQRSLTLFDGASCNGDDIDHILDDEGDTPVATCANDPAPAYPDGARLIPDAPLSAFDGDLWNAAWHLTIEDDTAGNTGTFVQWCLVPQLMPVPTVTAMPTLTPTPTATGGPSTVTPTATGTPTTMPGTITATPTQTGFTPTPTATYTSTPTGTPTTMPGTITATPTQAVSTATPTGTPTTMPGTITATPTEVPPTGTASPTSTPPVSEMHFLYLPLIRVFDTSGTPTPQPPDSICTTVNAPIETNVPLTTLIFPGTSAIVTDMDVRVTVEHPAAGELAFRLTNSRRTVTLFEGAACSGDALDIYVDDEGSIPVSSCADDPAPAYPPGAHLLPVEPLAAFDGDRLNDGWYFTIEDTTSGNTGMLVQWCLVPSLAPVPTITPAASNPVP